MKKLAVAVFCLFVSLLLVGCGSTPEESFVESVTLQADRLEAMGENLNTFGDQMFDGTYSSALTSLWLVQDDVDALQLRPYVWSDSTILTLSNERTAMLDKTNEMLALLRPILEKLVENPDYTGTEDEIIALERAEALTSEIDGHLTTISNLVDTYLWEE